MAHVPGFDSDVFISFGHHDNQAVGTEGWVSHFHQRLELELNTALGVSSTIWRDPRIGRASNFQREIEKNLKGSAVLLAVLSPSYRESKWCELELQGFVGGSQRVGDLWIDGRCRAIKVIKRPVEGDWHRHTLPESLGFQFFTVDKAATKSYELSQSSEQYQRLVTDLADEVRHLLVAMRRGRTVYLGAAPAQLSAQRARVRRELEDRRYRVIASDSTSSQDMLQTIRQAVNDAAVAVRFVTAQKDSEDSDTVAATERNCANAAHLPQVVVVHGSGGAQPWNQMVEEEDGQGTDSKDVEVLFNPRRDVLSNAVFEKLNQPQESRGTKKLVRIYLICTEKDNPLDRPQVRAGDLRTYLMDLGFEVKTPDPHSRGSEYSKDNRAKLKGCDAVVIYWGSPGQAWFDGRLEELRQATVRRRKPFSATAAYVTEPQSNVKVNYETREVDELIKQFDELDPSDVRLARFIARLGELAIRGDVDTHGSTSDQ